MVNKKPLIQLSLSSMPFARVTLVYIVGLLSSRYVPNQYDLLPIYTALLFGRLCFIVISNHYCYRLSAIAVFSFIFLLALFQQARVESTHDIDSQSIIVNKTQNRYIAIIKEDPILKANSIRFPMNTIGYLDFNLRFKPYKGLVMITLKRDSTISKIPRYGDTILIKSTIQTIPPPFNPYEFDYKKYLANKGINAQSFVRPTELAIIGQASKSWITLIVDLRSYFVENSETTLLTIRPLR